MSVSALSDSLTEPTRPRESEISPHERGLQLDGHAFASCEHLEVPRHALGERAGVEVHEVDTVVGVGRTVVEQHQLPSSGFTRDLDRIVGRRMAEVTLLLE